jgi:hypothetical protein
MVWDGEEVTPEKKSSSIVNLLNLMRIKLYVIYNNMNPMGDNDQL